MYAIIETGGKQYKVSENDVIEIEKIEGEPGDKVVFDNIILISGDKLLAADDVKDAKVSATIMEHGKSKKVVVYHYKRKTGYHKKNGHRQPFTKVQIDSIG